MKQESLVLLIVINLRFYIQDLESCLAEITDVIAQLPSDF